MRKVDPNSVIDDFQLQVASALGTWSAIDAVLPANPVTLRRKVASDAFLTLAVAWESFLSDWWVGAINKDATTYIATTEKRLRDEAKRSFGLESADLTAKLVSKKHLTVSEVRRRLDPQERNVVIHGHKERQQRAQFELAGLYRARAHAITMGQWQTVECVRTLRNLLAHRSESARDAFDVEVRKGSLTAPLRWSGHPKLSVAGSMRYLATKREADPTLRVARFHSELSALAELLRVL